MAKRAGYGAVRRRARLPGLGPVVRGDLPRVLAAPVLAERLGSAGRRRCISWDGGVHHGELRLPVLSEGGLSVFVGSSSSWILRGQLRDVQPVAPGAVSHRNTRHGFCVRDFHRPVRRRRREFSGRAESTAMQYRDSRRRHRSGVPPGLALLPFSPRDPRETLLCDSSGAHGYHSPVPRNALKLLSRWPRAACCRSSPPATRGRRPARCPRRLPAHRRGQAHRGRRTADVVVLASPVIDELIGRHKLRAGSRVDLVRSGIAIAVLRGARSRTSVRRRR